MDKTGIATSSKIWPDSTCAISVRRKGQILLVVDIPVLSTTVQERQFLIQKSDQQLRYLLKAGCLKKNVMVTPLIDFTDRLCLGDQMQFLIMTKVN